MFKTKNRTGRATKTNAPHKSARWIKPALGLLIAAGVGYLFLLAQIYAYASARHPAPADAAVVLGAAVWDSAPSPVFEERIKHAIHLYQAGQVRALIFTGGVGGGDRLAESEVARAYALAHGVAGADIYCETVSHITYQNLQQASQIAARQGFETILIVSDPLHMKRAVTMARDIGMDAQPSPTPTSRYRTWRTKLRFLLREGYFYAGYRLKCVLIDVTLYGRRPVLGPAALAAAGNRRIIHVNERSWEY